MSLKYWAFIYLSPGFSPDKNTLETNSSTCRFKAVGIDVFQKELVIEVAKNLYQKVCRRLKFAWFCKPNDKKLSFKYKNIAA